MFCVCYFDLKINYDKYSYKLLQGFGIKRDSVGTIIKCKPRSLCFLLSRPFTLHYKLKTKTLKHEKTAFSSFYKELNFTDISCCENYLLLTLSRKPNIIYFPRGVSVYTSTMPLTTMAK